MRKITDRLLVATGLAVYGVFWAVATPIGHQALFEWGKRRLIERFGLENVLLTKIQREHDYSGEVPIFFEENRRYARVVVLLLFALVFLGKVGGAAAAIEALVEEEPPSTTVVRGETNLRQVATRLVACESENGCSDRIEDQIRQLELFNRSFLESRGVECRMANPSLGRGGNRCFEDEEGVHLTDAKLGGQSLREGDVLRR